MTSRGGATEEIAGGAAVLVDPRDPSIAAGIEEAGRRRESLSSRSGLRAPRCSRGAVQPTSWRIWRELVVTPLVVVDADVLGRQRTGDETYVRNLLRTLPGPAAEAGIGSRP